MMMPSIVSTDRILLRASARIAIFRVEIRSIRYISVFDGRHRLKSLGGDSTPVDQFVSVFDGRHRLKSLRGDSTPVDQFVAPELTVAKDNIAFRELGNVV